MKVIQINSTCGIGSTGKICVGISELMTASGIENRILHTGRSSGYPLGIRCADDRYIKIQALKSRLLGNYGFNSKRSTEKMMEEIRQFDPDIVHLHNIHSHDCDLKTLFSFFRENNTKIIWTFHDCWAFTGYCPHFTMAHCDKWLTQCGGCVQRNEYSWFFDRSRELYEAKKRLFDGLDMTIVTPSHWLKGIVKQSFLKDYPAEVIHNGIDLDVFSQTKSNFRQKHGLNDQKIILGVSFDWGKKKGLDVFSELAHRLSDDYRIVLIGTDEAVVRQLPDNILPISRTQDQKELAEIYSASDVFVNPTREENFPTVNMEALACGTPVITFQTGGSPEMLDETCGCVVDYDDVDALEQAIRRVCEEKPFSRKDCIEKAKHYDREDRLKEYLELYERIVTAGDERN